MLNTLSKFKQLLSGRVEIQPSFLAAELLVSSLEKANILFQSHELVKVHRLFSEIKISCIFS